jgi:hypothetical protein
MIVLSLAASSDRGARFGARPLIGPQYCIEIGVRNARVPIHHFFDHLPDAGKGNFSIKKS